MAKHHKQGSVGGVGNWGLVINPNLVVFLVYGLMAAWSIGKLHVRLMAPQRESGEEGYCMPVHGLYLQACCKNPLLNIAVHSVQAFCYGAMTVGHYCFMCCCHKNSLSNFPHNTYHPLFDTLWHIQTQSTLCVIHMTLGPAEHNRIQHTAVMQLCTSHDT